jgi:hypothetical protein
MAIGSACSECGHALGEDSIRPAWLAPVPCMRVRQAALKASVVSLTCAMVPLIAYGLGVVFRPHIPGPGTGSSPADAAAMVVSVVAVASTLLIQTFAGLRLAANALPWHRRKWFIAILVARLPLLVIVLLGTMVLLVTHALAGELPGGYYMSLTRVARGEAGASRELARLLQQAMIAVPAFLIELLLVRAVAKISHAVSDERPAWRKLRTVFLFLAFHICIAGVLSVTPTAAWVIAPMLLLLGNALLFMAVMRMAALHMPAT